MYLLILPNFLTITNHLVLIQFGTNHVPHDDINNQIELGPKLKCPLFSRTKHIFKPIVKMCYQFKLKSAIFNNISEKRYSIHMQSFKHNQDLPNQRYA